MFRAQIDTQNCKLVLLAAFWQNWCTAERKIHLNKKLDGTDFSRDMRAYACALCGNKIKMSCDIKIILYYSFPVDWCWSRTHTRIHKYRQITFSFVFSRPLLFFYIKGIVFLIWVYMFFTMNTNDWFCAMKLNCISIASSHFTFTSYY